MRKNTDTFAERIISKLVDCLASRREIRAIALVGSRGSGDPGRIDQYSDADFLICCHDDGRIRLMKGDWISEVENPVLVFPQIFGAENTSGSVSGICGMFFISYYRRHDYGS